MKEPVLVLAMLAQASSALAAPIIINFDSLANLDVIRLGPQVALSPADVECRLFKIAEVFEQIVSPTGRS